VPLEILLPLVILGIVGAVILIGLLRLTPDLVIETPDQAAALWAHFNPDIPAGTVHLNANRSHALIETPKGLGVVWSFGADPVTRLLHKGWSMTETAKGVRLITHDFTAPVIDIPLPHEVQRKEWRVLLESLK